MILWRLFDSEEKQLTIAKYRASHVQLLPLPRETMNSRQTCIVVCASLAMVHALSAQAVGRNAATRDSARKIFQPKITHDEFEKSTITVLKLQSIGFLPNGEKQNINTACGFVGDVSLYLVNWDKIPSGYSTHNFLIATSSGSSQFDIDGRAAFRLVSGDSVVALRPAEGKLTYFESATSNESGQRVAYVVPPRLLGWIGSRPSVKVRVPGRSANCDFSLWDEGLDMIAMFDSLTGFSNKAMAPVRANKRPHQ